MCSFDFSSHMYTGMFIFIGKETASFSWDLCFTNLQMGFLLKKHVLIYTIRICFVFLFKLCHPISIAAFLMASTKKLAYQYGSSIAIKKNISALAQCIFLGTLAGSLI